MMQASPGRRGSARRSDRTGRRDPRGRYGLLLLLLIFSYLLSASTGSRLASEFQVVLFVAVLLLALRTARVQRRTARLAAFAALLGSAGAIAADLTGTDIGVGIAAAWKALILLLTAVIIVSRVLARPTVTAQSIYGALSAYMILGLTFAAVYTAVWRLGGGDFFANGQPANTQTFQYFSFTTLTTLGYGDFTAVNNGGRAIAVLEALTGQVFLATLVARLVAAFRAPAEQSELAEQAKEARPVIRQRWRPQSVAQRRTNTSRSRNRRS